MNTANQDNLSVISFNGAKLKVYNFGGSGPTLIVAHATGFNSPSYRLLATELVKDFTVIGIDAEGHGFSDLTPDGSNWSNYAKHIEFFIRERGLRRIFGFGHSFGGAALIQAAASDIDAFEKVVTYEPVIFPGPPSSEPNYDSPITQLTLKRQFEFDSKEQASANFKSKPPMNSFASGVVEDYVDGGTHATKSGTVELNCDRNFEASVYAHAPMAGIEALLPKIKCQVAILFGEKSKDFTYDFYVNIVSKAQQGTLRSMDSIGHFGPFEDPERVAKAITTTIFSGDNSGQNTRF
ncbi:MAG: alpha/beta hydrolase [Actinomycetota bacterium]|nr:alpha/beta hydrolase [Actinomycetota bacterium]